MSVSLFKISPALRILIDAEIVTLDDSADYRWNVNDPEYFTFELFGPWSGSDYSGDDVTESNQRSLYRDHKDLLIDATRYWGHSAYGLQVESDFGLQSATAEAAEDLARTLAGLKYDYPLYDEQDNAELIMERAVEAWGSWLSSDLESNLSDLTGIEFDLDDHVDLFHEACRKHDIWPEAEGHRDVIFPGIDKRGFLLDLATAAARAGAYDVNDVSDLTPEGYKILGSVIASEYRPECKGQLALIVR